MALHYERLILDAVRDGDALVVLAPGLGLPTLLPAVLQPYCDPAHCVVVVGASADETDALITALALAGTTARVPRTVDGDVSAADRYPALPLARPDPDPTTQLHAHVLRTCGAVVEPSLCTVWLTHGPIALLPCLSVSLCLYLAGRQCMCTGAWCLRRRACWRWTCSVGAARRPASRASSSATQSGQHTHPLTHTHSPTRTHTHARTPTYPHPHARTPTRPRTHTRTQRCSWRT
jgi:hypothetical protein